MFKRLIGAALASAAAIGVAVAVKLLLESEDSETEEDDEESEVRFVSIEDGKPEETAVKEDAAKEAAPAEKKEEKVYPAEIEEIAGLYPYLEKDFIAEQFARNDVFNQQYPEDSLVRITHKAKFADEETMRGFVKICEDNGYTSEVLSATEAAVSRKLFTEDGAILSDIYNLANQVACLKGTYGGYNIEL
ncbi:MAG: hypothetical protein IKS32_02225 [Solobacterium sp.]|nr:hypothetical protein [Solobacterium sp.]